MSNTVQPTRKEFLEELAARIGWLRIIGAGVVAIVVATIAVGTVWATKADAEDLSDHVEWASEEKARIDASLDELEERASTLEAMQRGTIDQVVYMRDRLDGYLDRRGYPAGFPPELPAALASNPPGLAPATSPTPAPSPP